MSAATCRSGDRRWPHFIFGVGNEYVGGWRWAAVSDFNRNGYRISSVIWQLLEI